MKARKKKTPAGTAHEKKERLSEKAVATRTGELAEPLCGAEGVELVHVEYRREAGGRILRLYIDKPGGVLLEDCARISRQLDDLLDVYLENIGPYSLEVTSPGQDRPLGKASHFEQFRGHAVRIRTPWSPDDDRRAGPGEPERKKRKSKTYKGVLLGMSEGRVNVSTDHGTLTIPFEEITQARLVPEKS